MLTWTVYDSTLGDVVDVLRKGISSEEFYVVIRRSHVLEDLLECMAKRGFNPSMKLNVCMKLIFSYQQNVEYLIKITLKGKGHAIFRMFFAISSDPETKTVFKEL